MASDWPRSFAISADRQRSGRQRQAGALAGHAGGSGLERDLDIRLFGDRPQHAGRGALEFLGACVVFAGPAHARRPAVSANFRVVKPPVGMSSLKQR